MNKTTGEDLPASGVLIAFNILKKQTGKSPTKSHKCFYYLLGNLNRRKPFNISFLLSVNNIEKELVEKEL